MLCSVARSAKTSGDLALGAANSARENFLRTAAIFARAKRRRKEETAPRQTDALL